MNQVKNRNLFELRKELIQITKFIWQFFWRKIVAVAEFTCDAGVNIKNQIFSVGISKDLLKNSLKINLLAFNINIVYISKA